MMGSIIFRAVLAAAFAATLASAASADVTEVTMPDDATDIHFQFAPGTCIDGIRITSVGAPTERSYYPCTVLAPDIVKIDFVYNTPPTGFKLFGIFPAGAPETVGRYNIAIVDAWWTKNNVFYQSIWPPGESYVVTIPEPASWAMLITGFGLIGVVARRRRMQTA